MRNSFCLLITLILLNFNSFCFADCTQKPSYIPDNYTIISCGKYSGQYLESFVVKNKDTNKLAAFTYWNASDDNSSNYKKACSAYNKMVAGAVFDEIIPVKNGFIVKFEDKYGYAHIDKGFLFDTKYDLIYLSNDGNQVYAKSGTQIIEKDNRNQNSDKLDSIIFNIYIKPLFFWLDDMLPKR